MSEANVITVACNNCGAPLAVQESTRFVTCRYCSSRLEVHRAQNSAYTEVLQALEARTEQIAEDLETITLQNALEVIDRDWAMEREQYLHRDRYGNLQEPSAAESIAGAVVLGIAGIIIIYVGASTGSSLTVAGPIALIAAIALGAVTYAQARAYTAAQHRHRMWRAHITAALRGRQGDALARVQDDTTDPARGPK